MNHDMRGVTAGEYLDWMAYNSILLEFALTLGDGWPVMLGLCSCIVRCNMSPHILVASEVRIMVEQDHLQHQISVRKENLFN